MSPSCVEQNDGQRKIWSRSTLPVCPNNARTAWQVAVSRIEEAVAQQRRTLRLLGTKHSLESLPSRVVGTLMLPRMTCQAVCDQDKSDRREFRARAESSVVGWQWWGLGARYWGCFWLAHSRKLACLLQLIASCFAGASGGSFFNA